MVLFITLLGKGLTQEINGNGSSISWAPACNDCQGSQQARDCRSAISRCYLKEPGFLKNLILKFIVVLKWLNNYFQLKLWRNIKAFVFFVEMFDHLSLWDRSFMNSSFLELKWSSSLNVIIISKIQLVVYYQCCVLIIGWATSRLCVIAH